MGNKVSIQDELINLKLTSKSMARASQKCTQKSEAEKKKVKKAIADGIPQAAQIYAQNAIREQNQSLKLLQLSARIDAVASRLDMAVRQQQISGAMVGVTKGMDKAMKSMNLEKISAIMDKFEKQFEDMDVHAQYIDAATGSDSVVNANEDEVNALVAMVADEHKLELGEQFEAAGIVGNTVPAAETEAPQQTELEARMANLRGK
uniref:Uncharacterized protein n=1 Tax=Fibrocapsa japonica TaxID=94617 RepID=A0A7S2XV96_9STRA